ncbi:MAG TPA: glycosyltransferase family 39 protein [Thermodesulfobacteriota bacterium]|nr:glycosyltransferase family 39 protein [Thermodesulfobacteriota bacterium]
MISQKVRENHYIWLLGILFVGFVIRLWLLDTRWINPDEGAHLLDGVLVLDGLVPKVDFGSRQPFYVYVIAIILKLFGISYISVRLFLPLVSTMGVCVLVFFISRKLFDQRVALLATAIYTFLPLSIIESTIVKTEPLTVLLSCTAVYFVILGVKSERRTGLFLLLSGVFLSLAYYVRESSLAILLAVLLFFIVAYWDKIQKLFISYGIFLCGYLLGFLLVFAYYSRYMPVSQILLGPINPLNFFLNNLIGILGLAGTSAVGADIDSLELVRQPWSQTIGYLYFTLITNSFLFVGLISSVFIVAYVLLSKGGSECLKKAVLPLSLLYSWVFSLGVAYSYWTLKRGFYIQYFEEFLPPLSILLAFAILYSLSKLDLEKNSGRNIAIVAVSLPLVFFLNRKLPYFRIENILYFLIPTLLLSFFYFSKELVLRRWFYAFISIAIVSAIFLKLASYAPYGVKVLLYLILIAMVYLLVFKVSGLRLKRDFKKGLGFITSSILISSFVLSFAQSGRSMGVDFDCVWSPETVREASDYIKENSEEKDEIISGAAIWEFVSNRKPFMNQTHPLVYLYGIPEGELKDLEWKLSEDPPKFIILDGYTERTYLKQVSKLKVVMDEKYELKKVIDGSRYPVKIYELDEHNTGGQ